MRAEPARAPRWPSPPAQGLARGWRRLVRLAQVGASISDAPHASPAAQALALRALCASLVERLELRLEVAGRAHASRPALLVANHLSYLDPLVLHSVVPCLPLAKAEVALWPWAGPRCAALGTVFVDRAHVPSRARALRRIRRLLASGVSVLNFPEGTTSTGDSVLPFHRGTFGVARRLRVPVVPVCVRYPDPSVSWVGDDAFVPHLLRLSTKAALHARVTFLPALEVAPDDDASSLAASARAAIAAAAA